MKKYKIKIQNPFVSDVVFSDDRGFVRIRDWFFSPESFPDMFEEIKEPLLITEDGVEYFDKEDTVIAAWIRGDNTAVAESVKVRYADSKTMHYFSVREKALEWCKLNILKFSEKQVLDALNKANSNTCLWDTFFEDFRKKLGL